MLIFVLHIFYANEVICSHAVTTFTFYLTAPSLRDSACLIFKGFIHFPKDLFQSLNIPSWRTYLSIILIIMNSFVNCPTPWAPHWSKILYVKFSNMVFWTWWTLQLVCTELIHPVVSDSSPDVPETEGETLVKRGKVVWAGINLIHLKSGQILSE